MMPILIYAVTADQSYPGIDKILDDKLITRLNRVDGVASVIVAGAPERVVYVDLDPNKLDAYNLTLEQIGNKILAENKDVSSGNVKMGLMDYALRVEGEFAESDQIKNIVLGTQNNKPSICMMLLSCGIRSKTSHWNKRSTGDAAVY